MPREFPTYIFNEGILIRTIFPKFIAHVPATYSELRLDICEWWDEADSETIRKTIHHAKKWITNVHPDS